MGRPYAKLFRDIWTDPDFTGMPTVAQYMYLFLISQPNLNAAGVLPVTVRRWTTRAGNVKPDEIKAGLEELAAQNFIVVDWDTEELLVRTFIRNDGLWRIPNTLYAVLRDAEQTVSPTLRATLAAEFRRLPVDNLEGKRSADMKAQVIRVTATLSATLEPTEGPIAGMRVRVGDAGAGGVPGSNGAVVNQSSQRYARARENDDNLIDQIQHEVREATGRDITPEWALQVRDHILNGRQPSDPAAYIRAAIRNDPNPRLRFLEQY